MLVYVVWWPEEIGIILVKMSTTEFQVLINQYDDL